MSDIFKKISSIEPEDEDTLSSLGLKPLDLDNIVDPIEAPDDKEKESDTPIYSKRVDVEPVPEFITHPDQIYSTATPSFTENNGIPFTTIILSLLLWAIIASGISYFLLDFGRSLTSLTSIQMTGLVLLFLIPALLLSLTIYAWHRLSQISNIAVQLEATSRALMTPDDHIVETSRTMKDAVAKNISLLNSEIENSSAKLTALKSTLNSEADKIEATSYATEERTALIAERLSTEREALWSISKTFDEKLVALKEALTQHSEAFELSYKTAEQKIQEARVSVDAAAEKILSASDIVRDKTVSASERLESNHKVLAGLSENLRQSSSQLESVFSKHSDGLRNTIANLKGEQTNFGTSLEEELDRIRDISLSAQVSAENLIKASKAGSATVEALQQATQLSDTAVKQQFSNLEEMVSYSSSRAEDISEKATRKVQESLVQTRKEIARIEDDMLALQNRLKHTSKLDSEPKQIPPTSVEEADLSVPIENAPKITNTKDSLKTEIKSALGLKPLADPEVEIDTKPAQSAPELRATPDHEGFFSVSLKDEPKADYTLQLIQPEPDDIASLDPDEDIKSFEPEILKRTIPENNTRTKPEKNGPWWKSIFAGNKNETLAIDRLTARPQENSTSSVTLNAIQYLTQQGLSPDVIVDSGCISLATKTRLGQGANAMSRAVANRLKDPILHLKGQISKDPTAKSDLSKFAAQFHMHLEQQDQIDETIQAKLDTETGRAFLLCDAALNATLAA